MADKKTVNARNTRSRPAVNTQPPGKPKLGQHFLRDAGAARRIVEALGDIGRATVIEIGPGPGALTALLAARAQRLIAVEIDRVLAAQLRMKYARNANVEVIEGDILSVELGNLIRRKPGPLLAGPALTREEAAQKVQVIGNLPYYITSDILLHLLEQHELLETIVIMVQREVAERIAAEPGTRDYGLLSATVQLFCRVEKLFTLPPGAFSPPPEVHSSVLRLRVAPQMDSLGVEPEEFISFLKVGFAQKRKTLANNLKQHYDKERISAGLRAARIRPETRAEAIPLDKMAVLFKTMVGAAPTS